MLATKPDTHQSTAGEDAAGDTHEQDGAELRTNLPLYILKSIYNDSTLTKLHRCRMTKTDL